MIIIFSYDLFQPKIVQEKVAAAKDLCVWCYAMKTYFETNKKVAPKKAIVAKLQEKLKIANDSLQIKQQDLN